MVRINLLFLLLPILSFSQRLREKDLNTNALDSIKYTMPAAGPAPTNTRLPFRQIEIIDARFDTSKLGFVLHKKSGEVNYDDFKKIKLEGGVTRAIRDFYNAYFKLCLKDPDNELLVVLKTLWIDNLPSPDLKENKN